MRRRARSHPAIKEGAPAWARIVVVGVCMEADRFKPFFGIAKQLNLQFVLGYTAEEVAKSLRHMSKQRALDVGWVWPSSLGREPEPPWPRASPLREAASHAGSPYSCAAGSLCTFISRRL
jgi:hypothetical protein